MSRPREPLPGKLIMSIFARDGSLIQEALALCERKWGEAEFKSGLLPFDFTDYYEPEFGTGLRRGFFAFKGLVPQDSLVEVKHDAWAMELAHSRDGKRLFNIDPGILTLERLVLATGKNYTHRIYLGRGVFGDLTLIFRKGSYQGLEWTYRDYLTQESISFWNKVRAAYRDELKARGYF